MEDHSKVLQPFKPPRKKSTWRGEKEEDEDTPLSPIEEDYDSDATDLGLDAVLEDIDARLENIEGLVQKVLQGLEHGGRSRYSSK